MPGNRMVPARVRVLLDALDEGVASRRPAAAKPRAR
jgi:hypothetical protein